MPYGFGSLSYSKNGKGRWIWTKNRRHYGSGSHRQGRSAIICGTTKAPDGSRKMDADALKTARNIKNFIDIAEEANGFLRSNCRKTKVYIFFNNAEGVGKQRVNTFAPQMPAIYGCPHLLRCGFPNWNPQSEFTSDEENSTFQGIFMPMERTVYTYRNLVKILILTTGCRLFRHPEWRKPMAFSVGFMDKGVRP